MTTLFSDDFNRANSSTLGGAWSELSGDWRINSNGLNENNFGAAFVVNTTSTGTPDYAVEASIYQAGMTTTSGCGIGILARCTDINNAYFAWLDAQPGAVVYRIYKLVAATFTELGTSYNPGGYLSDPVTVRFEVQGTALRLYVNGTLRNSATDSAISAVGNFGARTFDGANTGNARLDSILVTDFAGSTFPISRSVTQAQSTSSPMQAVSLRRSIVEATSLRPIVRQFGLTRTITKATAATVQATRVFLRTVSATQAQSARPLVRQLQLPRTVAQASSLTLSTRQSLLRTVQAQLGQFAALVKQVQLASRTVTISEILTGSAEFSSGEVRILVQTAQAQTVSLRRAVGLLRNLNVGQTATGVASVPQHYALSGTIGVGTRVSYSFVRCVARTYAQLEAMGAYAVLEEFTYGDLEHECLGAPAAKRFCICARNLRYVMPARRVRFTVEVR